MSFIKAALVFLFYRLLSWTWRIRFDEPASMQAALKEKTPLTLAFWHGDELVLLSTIRRYRAATMTSTSKDGEIMDRVFRWLGGQTSRGSATRGAVQGLKGLLRLTKSFDWVPVIAVDGPKGPLHVVKPGIFEISRLLKAPIYACGISCDRSWQFPKSWNQTFLPKPFARVAVVWQGPFGPINREQDCRDQNLAKQLKNQLNAAHNRSCKHVASS